MTGTALAAVPLDLDRYRRFRVDFDALTDLVRELVAVEFAGVLPAPGGVVRRAELSARLGVVPAYTRLFDALVDLLVREGYLRADGDHLIVAPRLARARATALGDAHPEVAEYLPLLTACQGHALEVLSGRSAGTDVLFPGGSMALVAELYTDNVQTGFFNRLAADRVRAHVHAFRRRFPHSTPQVFEVGAGTGATTAFVLEALAEHADRLRYLYTDVGPGFLRMARKLHGRSYVDFARYNIEASPEPQGFEPHSMDVVLASNVLHATHRIGDTLEQCRRLLKPGGILVVNEMTRRLDYNTVTFGLVEGWWRFAADDPRIPGSPLLSRAGWSAALTRAGFDGVELHGVPILEEDEQVQSLIVAHRAR
ncbi:class I SAM-dependent methyltransferase [Phytohabitans suffuscus]|uniref:Methyltransferase type 12 domain-containing protein n=1 Tax=Phytohabitans suffuscus TaxID=624315 RepID=A0A6F8Z0W2_9ACTN|nr:class I SAM-dependent methyltransferase [Phytohabitans suffuscus]BCB91964.1 hypothetical protein Psuf_092770 [Phytohabitans suffuscus]